MFKSKNIFKEVKRLALEVKVSAKDFFLSEHFGEYLSNTGEFMTSRYKRPIRIRMEYEPKNPMVAYTDGDMVYINGANPLSGFYKNLNQKFHCWLGIFFHEVGHILFLDFPKLHDALNAVNAGEWWPKAPDVEYLPLLEEIEEYQRKGAGPVLARIIGMLSNIIADVHDERAMMDKFGPLVEKALTTSSYAMQETSKNLEDIVKDGMNDLSILMGLILNYIRFDEVFMAKEDYENEHVKRLLSVIPFVDEGRDTDSMEERFENINQIVLTIWHVIKDVLDKEEEKKEEKEKGEGGDESESGGDMKDSSSSSDSSSSGSGGDMESAIESILKELGEVAGPTSTEVASGGSTPVDSDDFIDGAAPSESFDSLEKELKEEKAELALEKERAKVEAEELREVERGALHKGISVNYRRKVAVTPSMKTLYDSIAAEVKPYVKTLIRLILPELKDKRQGGKSYGAIYGNKFEARSIARTDGRYFSKRKLPTDSPRLAVGVLVDESGSMGGKRAETARKAAILLEMFTSELDIPTLICGHSTEARNDFSLYSYVEPNKIDRNDKYRLADVSARSQNRDGLALKLMCERMMKMDEDFKLLIVISDGAPCDYDYSGPSAEREMQEICREYRKKGITIIAAAIGDDREAIQRIYQKGFLDISDLSKLPKTLVGLIKKEIK